MKGVEARNPADRNGLSLATVIVVALAVAPVAAGSQTQCRGLLTPDTAGVCTEDAASVATYTVTGT